jgi:hypothetical protein
MDGIGISGEASAYSTCFKMTHWDFFGGSTPTPVSKYTINELFCLTVILLCRYGYTYGICSLFLRWERGTRCQIDDSSCIKP